MSGSRGLVPWWVWAKPTVSGRWAVAHDADDWATYDWDVDEALLRVIPQGGSTVTGQANELYDAQMKRVARELDGTATYYVFDGEKIARVEQPEAGTRDFYVQEGQSVYSPLVSVHDESADAQYWYLFDALGSTMGLVDANGNLSGKLQYDAFGNVLEEENVPRSAFFKYVGAYQYMPEEFEDMMLLWHRWYDPTAGRFVGRDAAYLRRRRGGYRYAVQRATTLTDPRGLQVANGGIDAHDLLWDLMGEAWTYFGEQLEQVVHVLESIVEFLGEVVVEVSIHWLAEKLAPKVGGGALLISVCTTRQFDSDTVCGIARAKPPGQRDEPWKEDCKQCCGYLVQQGRLPAGGLGQCEKGCDDWQVPPALRGEP